MKKNRVYFYATIVSVGVILLNQVFIQYWLYQKKEDSNIINIGGKQRMLSQKLTVQVYSFWNEPTRANQEKIQRTYEEWRDAHLFLKNKFQSSFFLSSFSKNFNSELDALEIYFQKTKSLLDYLPELSSIQVSVYQNDQDDFLKKMNQIVNKLEMHTNLKLKILVFIEILFALISLAVIYYEIEYVFKRVNGKLKNQNQELTESNLMLEKYAYLAAHDLRTPTMNITNFAKLLKKRMKGKTNLEEEEYLDLIIQSSERLQDTTIDLLKFSTISQQKIKIEEFAPQKMVENVIDDLDADIHQKQALIELENFPKSIEGDPNLLRLVFQNLISNGVKFVNEDVAPVIKIRYHYDEEEHVFTIEDNGIGIEEEDKEKIFGLFKRLHNNESYEGTGIGLSICQKVLEKHKGEIELESEPEKGSTFKVAFPKYLQN